MTYIVVEFSSLTQNQKEILFALLDSWNFEGIEELDNSLKGYIPKKIFNEQILKQNLQEYPALSGVGFHFKTLPNKNWNEAWEKSYEPILINDKVCIRASFHQDLKEYPYDILIDPKMSFGTGHHETTQLMIEMMLEINFTGKDVLDFGSGTGILSILAHKMGAKNVVAVDFDEWAYNNIAENILKNEVKHVEAVLGDASAIPKNQFEVILANVNKNVIIQQMEILACRLAENGVIVFSGLLREDEQDIVKAAANIGLILQQQKTKNEWICLNFGR